MSKAGLPLREDGQKLYPTCNWERNQHKLYHMKNLAQIKADETHNEIDYEEVERIERLITEFNACVIDGMAYVAWGDGLEIKELIADYGIRQHDEMVQKIDRCDIPAELGWEEYPEELF